MKPIPQVINSLERKYGTCDPFSLAKELGICIRYEELGTVRGYYHKDLRQKFILLNRDLTEPQLRFTCAHELGHALLHPNENTPFLRKETLFSVSKLEVEANRFAVALLMKGIDGANELPISHIAAQIGVPEEVVSRYIPTVVELSLL